MPTPDDEHLDAVADELSKAVFAIERADYNAFQEDDLRALLDAHETLEELCQWARRENTRITDGDDE